MNLPLPINEEIWGEIIYMEMYAPELWFMEAALNPEGPSRGADGFYAIPKNYSGSVISPEALKYGELMGDVLYFDYDHGKLILDYELLRAGRQISAKRRNGLQSTLDNSLKDIAAVGSEMYPEYFGPMAIPQETPLGPVTRCKPIQNGVYLVEAGARWMIALSYPVWDDLCFDTLALALWNTGGEKWAAQSCGAAFFPKEKWAAAVYDLLSWEERYQQLREYIRWESLVAAMWRNHPDIVEQRNAEVDRLVADREQSCMDSGEELESVVRMYELNRIPTPTTGDTEFLRLVI